MDISPLVLAAVMNLMNVETEDDCEELFLPAEVAMGYHQLGEDFIPNYEIIDRLTLRASRRFFPETKDTPRRWTSRGKLTEELKFAQAAVFECEMTF